MKKNEKAVEMPAGDNAEKEHPGSAGEPVDVPAPADSTAGNAEDAAAGDTIPGVGPGKPPPSDEQPLLPPAPVKTLEQWAQLKGHVPKPGPVVLRGNVHTGRHIDVVLDFHSWRNRELRPVLARNSPMTEAEYEAAAELAYSIPIGEQLTPAEPKPAA